MDEQNYHNSNIIKPQRGRSNSILELDPNNPKHKKLLDILDDLCLRFIINLPEEELVSMERICFHLEAAHW